MGEGLYRKYKYKHKYSLARLALFYTQLQIVFGGLHTIETFWVQFRITWKLRAPNSNKCKSMGICILWTEKKENLIFLRFILCFKIVGILNTKILWIESTKLHLIYCISCLRSGLVWFYSFCLLGWVWPAPSISINHHSIFLPQFRGCSREKIIFFSARYL